MTDPSEYVVDEMAELTDESEDSGTVDEMGELRRRVAELTDLWRRTVADLDNVRKRAAREAATQRAEERAAVTAAWLPVIDNLDLALEHADADPETIVEGVRAVRDQALSVLAQLGYPRRDDTGQPFDPARHEAVATIEEPGTPPGSVATVVRPAYGDGADQLRPASVVVATGEH
jgi:molecular chaperone GrpE